MSGHYCKRAARRVYPPDGCMMQCGECGAWEALQLQAEYEAKQSAISREWTKSRIAEPYMQTEEHSRKPVGCNATGQTEPKGLDCAASQISVSGTNLVIRYERHGTSLQFERQGEDKTLVTMGHEMNGQRAMGIAMWLSDDDLNRIVEFILPKSQRWP